MGATRLTMSCEHVGCAAKIDAKILEQVVGFWQIEDNSSVRIGLTERDDVGCYDLGGEYLLLHNLDVITPIVDDGYAFGAIAVSHALSDVYAKGGVPISALSFLGIPPSIESSVREIIAGCSAKLREAGVALLGGHTISSNEPLVGFAVTGIVERNSIVSMRGACIGDKLVLTKPVGTGIISTAVKFSNLGIEDAFISDEELEAAVKSMELLNIHASKSMLKYHTTACTDVSGFGLIGHISNLLKANGVGARISCHLVPKLPGVVRLLQQGIVPVRMDENIRYYYHKVVKTEDVDENWPVLFCPETSGGLLIAIDADWAQNLIDTLNGLDGICCAIIGEVIEDSSSQIILDY